MQRWTCVCVKAPCAVDWTERTSRALIKCVHTLLPGIPSVLDAADEEGLESVSGVSWVASSGSSRPRRSALIRRAARDGGLKLGALLLRKHCVQQQHTFGRRPRVSTPALSWCQCVSNLDAGQYQRKRALMGWSPCACPSLAWERAQESGPILT